MFPKKKPSKWKQNLTIETKNLSRISFTTIPEKLIPEQETTSPISLEKTKEELIELLRLYVKTLPAWIRESISKKYDLNNFDELNSAYDLVRALRAFQNDLDEETLALLDDLESELALIDFLYKIGGKFYKHYKEILEECEIRECTVDASSVPSTKQAFQLEKIFKLIAKKGIGNSKCFTDLRDRTRKLCRITERDIKDALVEIENEINVAKEYIKEGDLDKANETLEGIKDTLNGSSYQGDLLELYRPKEYEDLKEQIKAEQEKCKNTEQKKENCDPNYIFSPKERRDDDSSPMKDLTNKK